MAEVYYSSTTKTVAESMTHDLNYLFQCHSTHQPTCHSVHKPQAV